MGAHHHLVCAECGTVTEFEDSAIFSLGSDEALNRSFSLLDCQFTVRGLCSHCAFSPCRYERGSTCLPMPHGLRVGNVD
jgi:Fe2+ or Zn2+ uptake regulation protein